MPHFIRCRNHWLSALEVALDGDTVILSSLGACPDCGSAQAKCDRTCNPMGEDCEGRGVHTDGVGQDMVEVPEELVRETMALLTSFASGISTPGVRLDRAEVIHDELASTLETGVRCTHGASPTCGKPPYCDGLREVSGDIAVGRHTTNPSCYQTEIPLSDLSPELRALAEAALAHWPLTAGDAEQNRLIEAAEAFAASVRSVR